MSESSAKNQYLATFVVNLLIIAYGFTSGWSSPNLLKLYSEDTPLPSGTIDVTEASWIVALLCVGGALGNILFGIITAKYGRKGPLMFISIPQIIGWLLVMYAQNPYYLYAFRIINGSVGGALFVIVPPYLNEIANDKVRGTLGSTITLGCNFGILLVFLFGHYLDYFAVPKFVISLSILFSCIFYFFPESPSVLVKNNRISEAERAIKFYQNLGESGEDFKKVQMEINKLQNTLGSNNEKGSEKQSIQWSDFKTNPTRKAFIISIGLAALNQFCGGFAMLNYTASIFKESGSNLDPNMAAIIVGVIQLVGSYVATVLVDRAGRKLLFLVSTAGTSLGLAVLGAYFWLDLNGVDVSAFNWVPITSFSFVFFISNCAVLTLPFLFISEIMPEKVKDFGIAFCMVLLGIFSFTILKYLPMLMLLCGMHGTMFLFSGFCAISVVFIMIGMPETKGKSYDQIMASLR